MRELERRLYALLSRRALAALFEPFATALPRRVDAALDAFVRSRVIGPGPSHAGRHAKADARW